MKTFVFDFDGVIVDTFEPYSMFLSKFMKISPQKARNYVHEHSKNNSKQSLIKMVVKNFYMGRFEKYLLRQEDLIIPDVLENIKKLPGNKYIISRNHSRICNDLLGSDVNVFNHIYGYNDTKNKVEAFKQIILQDGVLKSDIIFVSDTVGDYKEVATFLDSHQIWLDVWGFNSKEDILSFDNTIQILETPSDITKLGELQ